MKEIIITGASGFIGRNVVSILAKLDYKISVITRNKILCKNLFKQMPVKIVECDINHYHNKISINNDTSLLHLAWDGLPNYTSLYHIEKNFTGSFNFVKHMVNSGVSSVVVAGTCMEYGMKQGCLKTTDVCNPVTPYGLAKHSLHKALLFLQNDIDFNLAWARLFYITGKGQSPNSIIPQLDAAIDRGDKKFNMSKGEQLRDYLPLEKVVEHLIFLLVNKLNGTYNISSGTPISIRSLVENRIIERGSSIDLNLGHYQYLKYEPMAFWGKPNIPDKKKS